MKRTVSVAAFCRSITLAASSRITELRRFKPGSMMRIMAGTINLTIKRVPTRIVERLKERAARNNQSLQTELQAILEEASYSTPVGELATFVRRLALSTPSESARMIREDRDDPCR